MGNTKSTRRATKIFRCQRARPQGAASAASDTSENVELAPRCLRDAARAGAGADARPSRRCCRLQVPMKRRPLVVHNSLCNSLRRSLTRATHRSSRSRRRAGSTAWRRRRAAADRGRAAARRARAPARRRGGGGRRARGVQLADAHAALERADAEAEALEAARAELDELRCTPRSRAAPSSARAPAAPPRGGSTRAIVRQRTAAASARARSVYEGQADPELRALS